jgi:hypothetical protein
VTAMTLAALLVSAPAMAIGLYDLQAKLERWAYERHAED